MKYRLQIKEHEEIGLPMAIILGSRSRSYHDPVMGTGIAHDILEHPTKIHPDPFIDELLALGGIIAGRYQNTYNMRITGLKNVLYALMDQAPESFMMNSSYPNNKTLKNKERFEEIRTIVSEAIQELNENSSSDEDEFHQLYLKQINEPLIVSWMCEGYSRFKKRFRCYDLYDISNYMFDSIEHKLDQWIQWAELEDTADLYVNFNRYGVYLIPFKHD
jgi:hypothetical protein